MNRIAAGLLLAVAPSLCQSAPYIPTDDAQVLQRLGEKRNDRGDRELAAMRAQLSANPDDLALASQTAWRYIEQSRAESDPRYLGYAQAALKPWWSSETPPVEVLVLRATLKQSVHDFDGALRDLALALERDPKNAQGWLTRATVLQVQGKYGEASKSCARLRGITSDWIAAACEANVASLNGKAKEAYAALFSLRGVPESQQSWIDTSLAEIAERIGELEKAEAHYRNAVGRGDAYAKAAFADFLLDRKRYGEVIELLNDETRADALLLRLAIAESALGHPNAKQHTDTLSARFAASRMRGDKVHLREEARFALHLLEKPDDALTLAQENWKTQREPADARIFLEAAVAANDQQAGSEVVAFLRDSGLEDVRLRQLLAGQS